MSSLLEPIGGAASALRILQTQSLTGLVQVEIERMILDGELEPGSRVKESVLAVRLGVSRGPIREACRGLAAVGLLDVTPSRGFSVRRLNDGEIADLYEARAGLCGYAGTLLVDRLTSNDLEELVKLVDEMDHVVAGGDVEKYYQINFKFHRALVRKTGNLPFIKVYEDIVRQLRLCRVKALSQIDSLRASNAEHREIVHALSMRNSQQAFSVMMNHVKASYKRLRAILDV